jgi:hypothetical protein
MTSAVDERGAADSFCGMTLEHTLRLTAPRSSSPAFRISVRPPSRCRYPSRRETRGLAMFVFIVSMTARIPSMPFGKAPRWLVTCTSAGILKNR